MAVHSLAHCSDIACGADFTFAVSDSFINYQTDYFSSSSDNICHLNQRKLHYQGSLKSIFNKFSAKQKSKKLSKRPQYRQPGLPSKTASERRKHQKEIEKLQQIFKKGAVHKRQQKQNNKFGELLSHSHSLSSSPKNERKKERKRTNLLNKMKKNKSADSSDQNAKGYSESDINRAVDYWCKMGVNDFEKQRHSPKLRSSLWQVGIPTRLRGKVWRLAIGNQLNINEKLFKLFEERAKQMKENENMLGNEGTIKYISTDLTRTFPSLSYFQDDGPLNETLHSLLQTYCFYRPDRGYIQGMSYLAANFLLYMDSFNAFVSFCNLLNMPFFDAFLSLDDETIKPRLDIFNALFEHNAPVLFKRFAEEMISPKEYFLDWCISLFTKKLAISVASRVWDIVLIFGEIEIYRCCVAVLKCLKKELMEAADDKTRKLLKMLPNTLKEAQLMSMMKTIKVTKKIKQQLQNL